MANSFDKLVDDLESGELTIKHIDIAVMAWVRRRKDIPEGAKTILYPNEAQGPIRPLFKSIRAIIGGMELAFRRGGQPESK